MRAETWNPRADAGSTRLSRVSALAIPLLVASVTTLVWCAVRAGPYRLDDFATPLDDPASASLSAWLEHLPRTLRPFTKLSYALEASLGVTEAAPRRAVTAAIHALGAGALAVFLVRVSVQRSLAALLALVWALHPIHAESVLSVAGRSAAVGATSVLISLALLACERPRAAGVFLALGVLGREATAAAGLGLAVCALYWNPGRRERLERVGPLALALIGAVTWAALRPRAIALAEYSFLGRPFWSSVVQQISALPLGLSLYVRPWALSCDHGETLPASPRSWLFVLGVLLLIAPLVVAFLCRKRAPLVSVGLCLWLGALLPTQSFFPKLDPLTERPLGLALAGLVVLLAPALIRASAASVWTNRFVHTACAVTALLALRLTLVRGALYASDVALWADAAAKSETNARPFVELGLALDAEGRRSEAIAAMRRALEVNPFSSPVEARLRLWERAESPEEEPR